MDAEAERFWSEFERETGEKVVARAVGSWYEDGSDERGVWGLVVLTDASFRFKYLPSENWFASLFRAARREPARAVADITVPRESLVAMKEPHRTLASRLFGSAFPRFTLSWREGELLRSEAFAVDPSTELLPRLREHFSPHAGKERG
ncbi:MAG TPA: hypothetical protein VFL04_06060 [Rectinemataceae bacterium]|nr:hypothetical protein [Rectinemataceae bacterium]